MQSIFLNAELLRSTREMRKITQVELARLAAVSERTVRYAESGKPIRPDLARQIANVLNYSLDAIAVRANEWSTNLQTNASASTEHQEKFWVGRASRLMHSLSEFVLTENIDALLRLLHPGVVLRSYSSPAECFNGTYHGPEGVKEYFRRSAEVLAQRPRRQLNVDRVYGKGAIVILAGRDCLMEHPTNNDQIFWFNWIFTHCDELVIDLVQTSGRDS